MPTGRKIPSAAEANRKRCPRATKPSFSSDHGNETAVSANRRAKMLKGRNSNVCVGIGHHDLKAAAG